MDVWKKIGKALLFPSVWIIALLVPISLTLLIYAFVFQTQTSVISIIAYVISAYTLTVVCFRLPKIIAFFKHFKKENKLWLRWSSDARLRVNVSLYSSLIFNVAYAVFQLGLGLFHRSVWFYAMSIYYTFLGVMRFVLVRYSGHNQAGEDEQRELKRYLACGICILAMHIALSAIMGMVIVEDKRIVHHPITTIALAAYTFTSFTFAIINMIRYRKYQSPVFSASKAISMASATVSMFTLETAMLTAFGGAETEFLTDILLTATGIAVSAFVLGLAIYMITQAMKKGKENKKKEEQEDGKQYGEESV